MEHTTALADTSTQLKTNVTYKQDKIVPVVTFLDDDGHRRVKDNLLPIALAKNAPMSAAIIPGWVDEGRSGYMNEADLKTVYASGMFEYLGHTYSHNPNLMIYPVDSDLDYQVGEGCKGWLVQRGYDVNGFVYPQGESDGRVRLFTKKYFDFSFGGVGINDKKILDTMNINRIPFGSFTTVGQDTLAYYKSQVDKAVENNAWLVFMLHVGVQDVSQFAVLEELIDYIQSLNVQILNPTDAYKIHGNKVFMGDVQDNNFFAVNKFGTPFSSSVTSKLYPLNSVLMTTPATDFEMNTESYHKVNYSHAMNNGFPVALAGYLVTERYDKFDIGYTKQVYSPINNHEKFTRYALTGSTWSNWVRINPVFVSEKTNEFLNSTSITLFSSGITLCNIDSTNPEISLFPEVTSGILKTTKTITSGVNAYQEYHPRNKISIYKRYWDNVLSGWSVWQRVNTVELTGTISWNPILLANGVGETSSDIAVTGAVKGDYVIASSPVDLLGISMSAYVSATNIVKIRLQNGTGSDLDLPGGTFKVKVIKQ